MKNKIAQWVLFGALLVLLQETHACVTTYGQAGSVEMCTESQHNEDDDSYYGFVTDDEYDTWMSLLDSLQVDYEV